MLDNASVRDHDDIAWYSPSSQQEKCTLSQWNRYEEMTFHNRTFACHDHPPKTPYHSNMPGCWYCLWGACQKHLGPGFAGFVRRKKTTPKVTDFVGFANSVIFKMHLQFDLIIIDIIDGDWSNNWMQDNHERWQEKQQQMSTSPSKHGPIIVLGLDPMMLLEQKKRGRRNEKWPLKGGEIICNCSTVMRKKHPQTWMIPQAASATWK